MHRGRENAPQPSNKHMPMPSPVVRPPGITPDLVPLIERLASLTRGASETVMGPDHAAGQAGQPVVQTAVEDGLALAGPR